MVRMDQIESGKYSVRCPFCGKEQILNLDDGKVFEFYDGALVQDVFPEFSATDREILVSGICPECQKKMFGDDE